jgi:hypothetical protein
MTIGMPTKKPKGKQLTARENREISSFRTIVEHDIGSKTMPYCQRTLSFYKFGFDDLVMLVACGLHDFLISIKTNALLF